MNIKPHWHDSNVAEAFARAKQIGGAVIWSAPPNLFMTAPASAWGYWSDLPRWVDYGVGERVIRRLSHL